MNGLNAEVLEGPALTTLSGLNGPFDFIFIDADKANNAAYFREALRLSRPGSAIVIDNVIRGGAIVDKTKGDASVKGVWELNDLLQRETRVSASTLQTVGCKGYDCFTLALVLENANANETKEQDGVHAHSSANSTSIENAPVVALGNA